jgi:hypothetical protein
MFHTNTVPVRALDVAEVLVALVVVARLLQRSVRP